LPADCVLGEVGGGWKVSSGHLTRERMMMGARAIGATSAVLADTAHYVAQRHQFGHPISDFQTVRHKLADIRMDLFMARAGLYDVAGRADEPDASRDAAMVKVYAGDLYLRASTVATTLHGGIGYTREFAVQRHLRDAPMYVIGGGSAEVLRDVISRDMF
jgi:butyryl-CoA dehydrogenase